MSDDYHYRGNGYRGRSSYRGGYQGRGGYRGGSLYPDYRRGGYRGRPRDSYDSYTGHHQQQPHPSHHAPHRSSESYVPHNGSLHSPASAVKKGPLDVKMDELKKLNDDVLQLQLQKHKIMSSYTVLERHLKRELLNSELNSEKLEEMSWL